MRKLSVIAAALLLASCNTSQDPLTGGQQRNNTAAGAGLGAVAGALTGFLVTKNKSGKDQRKAALIGAGIGALVGGGIGSYMDRQEEELRAQLRNSGVSVTRNGDSIILNLPDDVTFASGQASLNPGFFQVLDSVSIVLNKYPKTLLDIDGHTDSDGDERFNQQLSEQRATNVARYLNSHNVDGRRLLVIGYGETRPLAPNDTQRGKALNRRVEVRISPLS